MEWDSEWERGIPEYNVPSIKGMLKEGGEKEGPAAVFDPIEDSVGAGSIAGAPDKCPKPVSIAIVIRLAKKGS